MHVASLDNCKRLYELSGWICHTPGEYWWHDDGQKAHPCNVLTGWPEEPLGKYIWPLYNSGYLFAKIPQRIYLKKHYKKPFYWAKWDDRLKEIYVEADTPEDALCKLSIKLFESGILKKGEV